MDAANPKVGTRMTVDEYMAMPEDGNSYELHDGILVYKDYPNYGLDRSQMSATSPLHNWIVMRLVRAISNFVLEGALGYIAGGNVDYFLTNEIILRPDVSFVAGSYPPLPERFTIAPTLAVKVISPFESSQELHAKINTYFKYGSRLVWIVYPNNRQVAVCRKSDDGHITTIYLTEQDTLSGEDVIPGLTIPIASLFPPEAPAS